MRRFAFLLLLFSLLAPLSGWADICDCDISREQVATRDALLHLDAAQQAAANARHLPWGVPVAMTPATAEHLLVQSDYILDYDDLRLPLWVAYRLTAADLVARRPRTECFRSDPRLPDPAASFCSDYDEPVFDRGHLPNADMTRSEAAMINTYLFSNMAPQYGNFNRIIWSRLENLVRDWARVRGTIYVISGAVFDRDGDGMRDPDDAAEFVTPLQRVAIPSAFYKILLAPTQSGEIDSLALLLAHDNRKHTGAEGKHYLQTCLTSIAHLEELTGIDFSPDLAGYGEAEKRRSCGRVASELALGHFPISKSCPLPAVFRRNTFVGYLFIE